MSPDEIPHHQFIGIPIWVPGDDALRQQLVDRIRSSFDCECVTNQDFIDIIPAGCTKGSGLAWLASHLGMPRSEVELYTFGDSFNDLAMHEVADESFSFTWFARGGAKEDNKRRYGRREATGRAPLNLVT